MIKLIMKKQIVTKLLAVAALSLTTLTSSALTITEAEALGSIVPATPSGDNQAPELVRFLVAGHNANNAGNNLNFSVNLGGNPNDPGTETYTVLRSYASDLPLPVTFAFKNDNGNSTINNLVATYQYVLGKYGQDSRSGCIRR